MLRLSVGVISSVLGMLLAIPILIIGLPFFAVAFLTRHICSLLEPQVVRQSDLIDFCPTIGWKPKPHLNAHVLADELFHVTTDADGWRGKTTIHHSDVIVFGDSYVFGHAIDDEHHFAALNPDVRIKAIGANGYNMVQAVLWMHELRSHLRHKLVVWFVFLGNDLLDNLEPSMRHYRTPFVRAVNGTGEWQIVTDHVRRDRWPFVSLRYRQDNYDRLAKICGQTSLSQRAFAACEYLIAEAKHICDHACARLVILTIPDPLQLSQSGCEFLLRHGADPTTFDPDIPDRVLRDICANSGVPFLAAKEYLTLRHYRENDDHWNEAGHQRVAELLSTLYHKYMNSPRGISGE